MRIVSGRARALDRRYRDDRGRELFQFDDSTHLGGGVDLVKTLELAHEEREAHVNAGQVARQLDQTIKSTANREAQLRMLDDQIAELTGQRRELEADPAEGGKKLLSIGEAIAREGQLDGLNPAQLQRWARTGELPAKAPQPDPPAAPAGIHPGSHSLHERVVGRIRDLNAPESEYVTILEQIMREEA